MDHKPVFYSNALTDQDGILQYGSCVIRKLSRSPSAMSTARQGVSAAGDKSNDARGPKVKML